MRRLLGALSAAFLLLGLLPAGVSASAAVDQFNNPAMGLALTGSRCAQTFQAGQSGLLTEVDLDMISDGGESATVEIDSLSAGAPSGSMLASGSATVPISGGWVQFTLTTPLPISKDDSLAIVVNTGSYLGWFGSANTYGRGQAWRYSAGSWQAQTSGLLDLAFKTYVDPQSTSMNWSQASIPVGVSTPLNIAFTVTFPGTTTLNPTYTLETNPAPSWYTPASGSFYTLTCSPQIAPANCTVLAISDPSGFTVTQDGNPIVISMTMNGNGFPPLSDAGTTATITMNACSTYNDSQVCTLASSTVAVGAAPVATPPPSTTVAEPRPTGSSAPIAPVLAGSAGLAALAILGRRRISRRKEI